MLFKALEGETAILVCNGVFRQCQLYSKNGELFAQVPGGFVRLHADGATTKPGMRLETLAYDGPLFRTGLNRICIEAGEGRTPLTELKALGWAG